MWQPPQTVCVRYMHSVTGRDLNWMGQRAPCTCDAVFRQRLYVAV
jgi:hypothetical protein